MVIVINIYCAVCMYLLYKEEIKTTTTTTAWTWIGIDQSSVTYMYKSYVVCS